MARLPAVRLQIPTAYSPASGLRKRLSLLSFPAVLPPANQRMEAVD